MGHYQYPTLKHKLRYKGASLLLVFYTFNYIQLQWREYCWSFIKMKSTLLAELSVTYYVYLYIIALYSRFTLPKEETSDGSFNQEGCKLKWEKQGVSSYRIVGLWKVDASLRSVLVVLSFLLGLKNPSSISVRYMQVISLNILQYRFDQFIVFKCMHYW